MASTVAKQVSKHGARAAKIGIPIVARTVKNEFRLYKQRKEAKQEGVMNQTCVQLRGMCKRHGVKRYSKMRKAEMVKAIRRNRCTCPHCPCQK